MTSPWTIGIIGGSGLYAIEGLEDAQWIAIDSAWGKPSDEVLCGRIGDVRLRFLPRHGRGHPIAPGELNAHANIDALKRAGCTDILAISAVGSLREEIEPGRFAVVEQFIDRTTRRPNSFFGSGLVAHVSMADPVCPRLSEMAAAAIAGAKGKVATGATYLAMEGPQFSTRAESRMYREWGADVIGMTAMPEAKLAREAELCYASVAMVTDYDSWHPDHGEVDVQDIIAILLGNADKARAMVARLPDILGAERQLCTHGCDRALNHAILTQPDKRDPKTLARLDAIAGRVLNI